MSETVLVTGGSGYIGGWAVAELLRRGREVRTTVRDLARTEAVRAAIGTVADTTKLSFAAADLTRDDGWDAAMDGVAIVLHVASPLGMSADRDPASVIGPAVDGAERVMRAATRAAVQRVVMTSAANASSPSSYAEDSVTDEALWTDPDDPSLIPYRRSKTLAELAAWRLAAEPDAPELATVLPGAVFGPVLSAGTKGSVEIVARMLRGEMAFVPNIGLEVVDVRDLVDLHLRAMDSPAAAGQRFLGTGEFVWMQEMAGMLKADLGDAAAKVSTEPIDDDVIRQLAETDAALAEIAPALGRRNRHSTEKARTLLGWQPRPARDAVVDCARSLIGHGLT